MSDAASLDRDTPRDVRDIPFPDLDSLVVEEVLKARTGMMITARRTLPFWNRLIAFYAHVRDAVGARDFPHPSGVGVADVADRALLEWCIRGVRGRMSQRERNSLFGMAWMDKGPSPCGEEVPADRIHLDIARAYPNGLDAEPPVRD
jgi:hypothetical protein